VGWVRGDYPVPAGYCTTQHYSDQARYYIKIWLDPGNLSQFICDCQLYLTERNAKSAFVMRPSLMHDTVASCMTDNCPLGASQGRTDGNLSWDGLINHPTRRIMMYILTDEAIMQHCFSCSVYCTLAWRDCLVPCIRFSDFYCDVIIMFRIFQYNEDLYLKTGQIKLCNKNNLPVTKLTKH